METKNKKIKLNTNCKNTDYLNCKATVSGQLFKIRSF